MPIILIISEVECHLKKKKKRQGASNLKIEHNEFNFTILRGVNVIYLNFFHEGNLNLASTSWENQVVALKYNAFSKKKKKNSNSNNQSPKDIFAKHQSPKVR